MKLFIGILVIFFSFSSWSYPCPEEFHLSKDVQAFKNWMESFKGQLNLENCEVEISVCNSVEQGWAGSPVAEVYIKDASGREVYLPISFVNSANGLISTEVRVGERRVKYLKRDRFVEEELGRTEFFQFEIRQNAGKVKSLDLGVYATKKQLNQPNGNDSHWYNCGEQK